MHWTYALLIAFFCFGSGLVIGFWVIMKGIAEAVEDFFDKLD